MAAQLRDHSWIADLVHRSYGEEIGDLHPQKGMVHPYK